MNESEIKILNEIIDKMDKILINKKYKYQDSWKICDISFLMIKLNQKCQEIFLYDATCQYNEFLKELLHIFNYAFFLYYRIKESQSNYDKQLSKKSFKEL